jgi:hypothetical protein
MVHAMIWERCWLILQVEQGFYTDNKGCPLTYVIEGIIIYYDKIGKENNVH